MTLGTFKQYAVRVRSVVVVWVSSGYENTLAEAMFRVAWHCRENARVVVGARGIHRKYTEA